MSEVASEPESQDGPSAPRRVGAVGRDDLVTVTGAVAAWVGSWWARPVAWWIVVVAVAVASVVRRPVLVWIAVLLVISGLSVRAHAGLDPIVAGPFTGTITLVTDPEITSDGRLRFEADSPRGHVLVEVRSPTAARTLAGRLAGERAIVVGHGAPFRAPSEWSVSRHLVGTVTVESVTALGPAPPTMRAANDFRTGLDRGAASLPAEQRSLLAGLVLGDDRAQPPELTADFRAAGLTHLLAVSGQNLAFVFVVVGPAIRRLRLWPRLVVSLGVIAAFALVTRFEPSVLRAAVVASVALLATTTGRPSGGVRHLAIAVVVLLAIDPLLVHSLGFRLSVAASVGVLVLAPMIIRRLPGPRGFRDGLGVTIGAQLAVAPVLVPVLGPMPLAALPANVVAAPLAGALMVWGLTAGAIAGLVGGPVAALLHLPSRLGLVCLETVASVGASLPMGQVDLRHVAVVGVITALTRVIRDHRVRLRVAALALVVLVIVTPVITPQPLGPQPAGYDATIWVDGPVAVVDVGARASPTDVVAALRRARVVAVGVIVVRSSRSSAFAVVDAVEARLPVRAVMAPVAPEDREDVVVPVADLRVRVGRMLVVVDQVGPSMAVRIGWRSSLE